MSIEEMLKDIVEDRRSGSSMILKKTLDLLEIVDKKKRVEIARKIANAHPAMAGLRKLVEVEMLDVKGMKEKIEEMNRKTAENLRELVKGKSVVTISRSHISEKGLTSAKKVAVLLSNPGGEGRDTFRYLRGRSVEALLVDDSAMGYAVKECDLVVVGADTILPEGFVNKVGTLPLALTARHFDKEFYVASPSYKITKECKIEMPFEFVPAELVTSFICEKGVYVQDVLLTL
jgi:translation initiation factor eIF-2B subunit delta